MLSAGNGKINKKEWKDELARLPRLDR